MIFTNLHKLNKGWIRFFENIKFTLDNKEKGLLRSFGIDVSGNSSYS